MDGERVGEPLPVGDEELIVSAAAGRLARERAGDDDEVVAGQPEPAERIPCAGAALERGADELGPQAPLHVGAGPHPQQMQRDELRGIPQRRRALRGERSVHGGPDRPEHFVARAHGDRDALGADSLADLDGIDDDGPIVAVELAEDAELGERARVALRHLAADDRLGPRGIRLLLTAREREHARGPVLDRDRGIQQRRDRVGDREEVAGRDAAERFVLDLADVVLGQQRPQQRSELRPGRAAREAEHRHAVRVGGAAHGVGQRHRRAHDDRRGAVRAELGDQRGEVRGIRHSHRRARARSPGRPARQRGRG